MSIEQSDIRLEIDSMSKVLNRRERDVIYRYYGIGTDRMNMREIGVIWGVSQVRIQQIRTKAERKVKGALKSKKSRDKWIEKAAEWDLQHEGS